MIGGVREEKRRGVGGAEESLCSGKSCDSHTREKLQVTHGKKEQKSEAVKQHLLGSAQVFLNSSTFWIMDEW